MVFGVQPECIKCKASVSNLWRKDDKDQVLCTECYNMAHVINPKLTPVRTSKDREEDEHDVKKEEDKLEADDIKDADSSNGNGGRDDDQDGDKDKDLGKGLEKRETKRKTRKGRQGGKGSIPKGKGRRYIFKKSGLYYQVGDIVSLIDIDGGTYYAQIRGLLQDQYCEKSAVLTWLIPTKGSPPPEQGFDPSTYIIGPEEDIPRKLEYMEFECHAPSDYFKDRTSPYSTMTYQPQSCFVWSRFGPQIKPIEKAKELMTK